MAYTDLKLELEKLLSEDLSNRNTLQEMRRNVFLNAEVSKKHESVLKEKDSEILNLRSVVNEKEQNLQLRLSEAEKIQQTLNLERNAFAEEKESLQAEIQDLKAAIASMQLSHSEVESLKEEASKLTIENSHFAAKIRELIFHIDEQNTTQERLEKELVSLRDSLKKSNAERSQLAFDLSETGSKDAKINALNEELESTKSRIILLESDLGKALEQHSSFLNLNDELESSKSKIILLETQLQQANELLNAQNNTIANLESSLKSIEGEFAFVVEKFLEEKELLVKDNGELIAEMGNLTLQNSDLYEEQKSLQSKVNEMQAQIDQFSDALSELRSKEQVILSLTEEKEKLNATIAWLSNTPFVDEAHYLSQIENLNAEIESLGKKLEDLSNTSRLKTEALEFEKNNLLLKLEDMENQLVSFKTVEPANSDEAFIDKLFQQINLLNDEKLLLQTENEEAHASLTELQNNCAELKQIIEDQKNEIENLEEQNKETKLAEVFLADGSDKTSLKLKINELVREIDKCIALLSV